MSAPAPVERLYALTPAVYRILDAEQGQPLRALMGVLEDEFRTIAGDIGALYDDWFIETCAEWLVPYIGELVGVREALDPTGAIPTVRSRVANALAYARRKGGAWVMARAARDVTGWQARAVEYFELLSATQSMDYVWHTRGLTADLRTARVSAAGSAFDSLSHTVELRTAADGGRWNPGTVGLFLWRLSSYPVTAAMPRRVGEGRYTFDPLGARTRLFVPPTTLEPFGAEPAPWEVPAPLDRELLEAALLESHAHADPWRASGYPVVAVWAGADAASAVPCRVRAADLSSWTPAGLAAIGKRATLPSVAVDPELGRLAFAPGVDFAFVRADWAYGFSADLGGGPYARGEADPYVASADAWRAQVGDAESEAVPDDVARFATLADALAAWAGVAGADGVIRLGDSATHPLAAGSWVRVPDGRRLAIVAADGERPCLSGDLVLYGAGRSGAALEGLVVDGTVRVGGDLELRVRHCTLSPPLHEAPLDARAAISGDAGFTGPVEVGSSIVGPLSLPSTSAGVRLSDSIVAGGVYALRAGTGDADTSDGPEARVERCTVFGMVRACRLTARDSIFTDLLWIEDTSSGSLTCCYAPPSGQMPERDRCQPAPGAQGDAARPVFTGRRYGDPAFAQLAPACPEAIRAGASDGSEMGAFHLLAQPRRTANLRIAIDQFLPNGLDVVVTYMT